MEQRANYAMVGLFVLVMLVAGLGFLFWLTNSSVRVREADLRIVFNDSVTGLNKGSSVLFNGIKVGEVVDLSLDEKDPNTVVAIIRVDRQIPVKTDTKALLSFQGLTGGANLQLSGGSRNAPLLFDSVDNGKVPTIQAEVSPFQDILKNAQNVLTRADSAMEAIDDFIKENGPAFNRTVNNIEVFSKALADNSSGIDEALTGVAEAGKSIGAIADDLKSVSKRSSELLAAVDPDQVRDVVNRTAEASRELDTLLKRANQVAAGLDPVEINKMMTEVTAAANGLNETITKAQAVVSAVDPAKVDRLITGLADSADNISASARKASEVMAALDVEKINTILASVDVASKNIEAASATVGTVLAAIDGNRIGNIIGNVDEFAGSLRDYSPDIETILADVKSASASIAEFGKNVTGYNADIDQIVADARSFSGQLAGIGEKADGLLSSLDGYVKGDGAGLIAEATETLKSIRKVSDTLATRIGPITDNLAQFSGRGLDGVVQMVADGRQALQRLDRVLAGVERNPQQFIFGGDDVPVYAPRRR